MKLKTTLIAGAIATGLLAAGTAQAFPPVTKAAGDRLYLGGKLSMLDHDDRDGFSYDKAFGIGVIGGYHLLGAGAQIPRNLGGGTLSLETELNFTAIDGDANPAGEWDATTLGAYAAYRFPLQGAVYVKARAGAVWNDVDRPPRGSKSDVDGSFGLGIGARVGAGHLEGEFTIINSNVTMFSIGYLF